MATGVSTWCAQGPAASRDGTKIWARAREPRPVTERLFRAPESALSFGEHRLVARGEPGMHDSCGSARQVSASGAERHFQPTADHRASVAAARFDRRRAVAL